VPPREDAPRHHAAAREEAQVLEHVGDGFTRADAGKVSHVAEQFHARIPHAVAAGAGETQPTRARQPSQFLDDPGGVTIRRGLAGTMSTEVRDRFIGIKSALKMVQTGSKVRGMANVECRMT